MKKVNAMRMLTKVIKVFSVATIVAIAPLLLGGCGATTDGSEHIATNHVGPTGPTFPSGYYFELTVTPHTIQQGGSALAQTRVWDKNGNMVKGVTVCYIATGGNNIKDPVGCVPTDNGGTTWVAWEIKGYEYNSLVYFTVEVEGTYLTLPVYIMAKNQP